MAPFRRTTLVAFWLVLTFSSNPELYGQPTIDISLIRLQGDTLGVLLHQVDQKSARYVNSLSFTVCCSANADASLKELSATSLIGLTAFDLNRRVGKFSYSTFLLAPGLCIRKAERGLEDLDLIKEVLQEVPSLALG